MRIIFTLLPGGFLFSSILPALDADSFHVVTGGDGETWVVSSEVDQGGDVEGILYMPTFDFWFLLNVKAKQLSQSNSCPCTYRIESMERCVVKLCSSFIQGREARYGDAEDDFGKVCLRRVILDSLWGRERSTRQLGISIS